MGFWDNHRINDQLGKEQTPATPQSLVRELREGRKDVSDMSIDKLHSHMTEEAELLQRLRSASGLPAIRPTQNEFDQIELNQGKFNLVNTAVTPADATRVSRKKP